MEPFCIRIREQEYEVKPYVKGYSVAFHIYTDKNQVIFELDEEDQLRAVTHGEPVNPALLEELAAAITKHFA